MANTIGVTLGPMGRNVAIEQRSWEPPRVTKDGVTVAKEIELKTGSVEDVGASLIYHTANNTNISAGDGTTTATILARDIFAQGMKFIQGGYAPMTIKRGIDHALHHATNFLYLLHSPLEDKRMITRVATISANGDNAIGEIVGHAFEMVGIDGIIEVKDGQTFVDEFELREGMQWERGYLSSQFITDSNRMICEYDYPLLLFCNQNISDPFLLLNIVEKCHLAGRSLVIIADNIEGEALEFLIKNKLRARVKVCAIRCPGSGDYRKYHLEDLAILTGANVNIIRSKEFGLSLKDVQISDLGECRKLIVHRNHTLLMDGFGDKMEIKERIHSIQHRMKTIENYLRPRFEERLIHMQGGIAIIKVGGTSDVEIHEKKDRIIDAINCVKSAIEQGILPGGGFALLYTSLYLERKLRIMHDDYFNDEEIKLGLKILCNVLPSPSHTIINNSGENGEYIVHKILIDIQKYANDEFWEFIDHQLSKIESKRKAKELYLYDYSNRLNIIDIKEYQSDVDILDDVWINDGSVDLFDEYHELFCNLFYRGYDSSNAQLIENMMDAGIVDPLKVTNHALIDAVSVAGMLITTECVITDVYVPYYGPPDIQTGERIDPEKHKVPKEFSMEKMMEQQQESALRKSQTGEAQESDMKQNMPGSNMGMMSALMNKFPGMMDGLGGGTQTASGIEIAGGGKIQTADEMIDNMVPGIGKSELGDLAEMAKMLEPMMKGMSNSNLPSPDKFELGPEEGGEPMPYKPKLPA